MSKVFNETPANLVFTVTVTEMCSDYKPTIPFERDSSYDGYRQNVSLVFLQPPRGRRKSNRNKLPILFLVYAMTSAAGRPSFIYAQSAVGSFSFHPAPVFSRAAFGFKFFSKIVITNTCPR